MEQTELKSLKELSRRRFLKEICGGLVAGGLTSLPFSLGCRPKPPLRLDRPNIILITLDTTRADRLGCYGYKRLTSPRIDRLANQSVIYTRAIAPSSWTYPSHASLFTGKFPSSHGAQYDPDGPFILIDTINAPSYWKDKFRARGMGKNERTLAQILKDAGYTTGAVVAGPWMKKVFGLHKGFDYYNDDHITVINGKQASLVTAQASHWLEQISRKKFFLFLNYFDPHYPYGPPGEFAYAFLPTNSLPRNRKKTTQEISDLYDAEILYMDLFIGKLLNNLKRLGLYDSTWIIVTADHGELIGEQGKIGHGKYLYQKELHIPLIMKYPGSEYRYKQEDVRLQLMDVFCMILDRLSIPIPPEAQGSVPPSITHPIFAEIYPPPALSRNGDWRAFFSENFKFLWNSKGNNMLFNPDDDPTESVNLIEKYPDRAKKMELEMNTFIASLPKPDPPMPVQEIDKETKEALKSLGYVK